MLRDVCSKRQGAGHNEHSKAARMPPLLVQAGVQFVRVGKSRNFLAQAVNIENPAHGRIGLQGIDFCEQVVGFCSKIDAQARRRFELRLLQPNGIGQHAGHGVAVNASSESVAQEAFVRKR